MSGTHKFTSSIWIQSGSSPATFESGISVSDAVTVSGNVTADKFVGDGSGITGLGGSVFFAGSGSGISASSPSSVDHVTELNAENAIAPTGYFKIETTSSAGFNPNHFVFIKLTDKFETLQAGSQNYYIGTDRVSDLSGLDPFNNDLAPGVHRYIVYATDTGSAGETHAVYTSAFIKGYVNVAPTIVAPLQSDGVVQIGHDENTLTHILRFTGSFEPNASAGDFIRIFSASRETSDPSINTTTPSYDLTMKHHQSDISDSDNLITTGSIDISEPYDEVPGAGPGASALPNSVLVFTASISGYNVINGNSNYSDSMEPREERFTITMMDNWYVNHSSSLEYSMSIIPPETASIKNLRARIESGSYTGIPTVSFTTPILYDDVVTRTDITGLHDRYTSSIVRVSVMADISEPNGYEAEGTHFTDVRIWSDDTTSPIYQKTFRFSGSQATASHYGSSFNFTNATESLGFAPFEYEAGTSTLKGHTTDSTSWLRHGDHDHISGAELAGESTLTVTAVPNIEISNIRVEVESGSFLTGEGAFERTASILYGYTSSLKVSETSSLGGYEKSAEYISESVVRLRLLATVTEPFGPHHTKISSSIKSTDGTYIDSFYFHTGSVSTASSAIAYDDQDRLVGNYTSSWIDFNLLSGEYTFSASFDSDTNASRTITPGTYAEVSVSNTPSTEITDIVYETETSGYSEEGSTDAMRTVLYGVPRYTLEDSSSFEGHDHAVTYASHSVSRFRVLATITEPFGPHHTASMFEKVWTNSSDTETFNSVIYFSTGSTDTASSAIAYDSANRLLARYTSSWIGQQLSSSNNAARTWTYTSGSITHTPNDLSGFTTASGDSTQLVINDTARIELSNRIHEFEEYGHSASSATDTGVTSTIRTVLYGSNRMTLADSSSLEGHDNTSAYASQSVSRVRARICVTEPVGPGHGELRFIPTLVGNRKTLNAFTSSTDFESISYAYDSQKRLITNYTESWHGVQITGAPTTETATFGDGNTTNQATFASGENGIILDTSIDADIEVFDTAPTQITNIRYQTETFGYSGQPSTDTTRKALYGVAHKTINDTGSLYWENHDSASLYASQSVTRFRVLATITEPIGPLHTASRFEKVWTADNESTITDVIHFSTASGDITASAVIGYDSSNRYVGHYTSSWVGVELASSNFTAGEEWKYTSGSILHEPDNENKFTTASGESTTLTVFDTQPTAFSNFKAETETFGYSGIPSQNTVRTILYGNTATDIDSSSYGSHVNSGSYASQSVSRFRLIGTITEPVGPLQHTASIIEKIFNGDSSKTETIIFGTGSSDLIESRSFFTEVGEFVTEYTSSWIGKELSTDIWNISTGSVYHAPPGENSANSSSFQATTLTVYDTAPTEITDIVYETETFGHSNEGSTDAMRTVLYGVPHHTLEDSSSFEGHDSASLYTSHSITRFRVRAKITEPVGPLHTASMFEKVWTDGSETFNSVIHFSSGSTDTASALIDYDSSNRYVGQYTSSWISQQLSSSVAAANTWSYSSGSILHTPTSENGFTTASGESTTLLINDTEKVKIEDIFWETETYGYSEVETSNGVRTVLYGNNRVTDINSSSYADHVNSGSYASQSVSRVRFRARVTEPIGPAVNAFSASFTHGDDSSTFGIHTSSIQNGGEISYGYQDNKLVAYYTSSWIGRQFNTDPGSEKTHDLTGNFTELAADENGFIQTDTSPGTIIVRDTAATQIDNIIYETETFGYSGIGSTNTTRTVLYGDKQVTNVGTGSVSWTSHDSASLYASQSVTQFRIQARITEPVGPLHAASRFDKVWSTSGRDDISETLHFSTASGDITASSTIAYDTSNRLVSEYISQWIGRGLSSSIYYTTHPGLLSGEIYTYTSGSILHEPAGENKFTTASGESTTITVFDTQPTQFNNISLETETFGYSGISATSGIRKVLYGIPHHTINGTGSGETGEHWASHESASLYASQSVTRFKVYTEITEPVGPLHTGSIIRQQFTSNPATSETIASNLNAIADISNNQSILAGNLVNAFDLTNGNGYDARTNEIVTIVFNEPQLVTQVNIVSEPDISEFTNAKIFASPDAGVTYIEQQNIIGNAITPERAFRQFKIEFRNSADEIAITSVEFKRATFTEPIVYKNSIFSLNSDSYNIESSESFYDDQSRLVSQYTSSYFGVQLSSSNNTEGELWQHAVSQIIHTPLDESLIIQPTNPNTVTMRVYDTAAPKYDNFKTETETYGYSNEITQDTIRTVLYGNDQVTDINSSSYENHVSASVYASHSVSRFQAIAKITEPVGPLVHTGSRSDMVFTGGVSKTETIVFGTGSDGFVKSYWTPVGEFVSEYTSSWISKSLESGDTSTTWTIQNAIAVHTTADENAPTNAADATTMRVNNTEPTQIDNIAYETETFGYSEQPSTNTTRKVLYGVSDTTLADSSSFADHVNSGSYASHSVSRFRVRARVTEPVGPLHHSSSFNQVWYMTDFGAELGTTSTNTLNFSTASVNIISKSYSDTTGKFIVEYTSSFSGLELTTQTDQNYTYTSGSILHEPIGENSFTTASGDSSTVTVINTAETQIRNLRIETETVGHSDIGVQNINESNAHTISRSILYGDSNTFPNSSSFEGLDSIFANSSVTRFRVLVDITEPIGPHHTGSMIAYTKAAGEGSPGTGDGAFIIFSTASTQTASSDITYNSSTMELEASYTSSWVGETLSPSKVLTDGHWHFHISDGNILHEPVDNSGVTKDTSDANLYMVVSASKPLTVTNLRTEVEAYPYSSSIGAQSRTQEILYGYNRTLSASDANTIGDLWSGSAAIRFRTLATITEPIGFQHFKTQVTMSNNSGVERGFEFHTASLETSSRSSRALNSIGQYITSYTSSWHDGFTFDEGTDTFTPTSITGSDTVGIYIDTDGIDVPSNAAATVIIDDTPNTQITNVRIEAETYSGSMIGTDDRTTTILHGNTNTETDKDDNAGYPTETARQQLTSIRLLADIAEPFGPHHTASKFTIDGYGSTHIVTLHTGSADISSSISSSWYAIEGSSSIAYTSSFVPVQLSQGAFTTNVITCEHMFEDSKTTTSLAHADITVEGSPSASVFVNPQTGSNNWSSSADIPLPFGNRFIAYNRQGDMTMEIASGISASAPPETSESILQFPAHLNTFFQVLNSSYSVTFENGTTDGQDTASVLVPGDYLSSLTGLATFAVKISGSNILPGSGSSDLTTYQSFIIPAKPQSMEGKYWNALGNEGHEATGIAYNAPGINVPSVTSHTTRLYTGTLAEDLDNYGPDDAAADVVNNIMMAKDSATGPTNYSMSFTPFDATNTGDYTSLIRLFDRGDTGSLYVRVNGELVVDYSLQTNFNTSNKSSVQDIANDYEGNGTASFEGTTYTDMGRLIVTQVEPFNDAGDYGFTNQGVHYPNGYQGWSARIEIDNKLREGYNKLEFSHSIDSETTQSWQAFDWYYDDNISLATTRANATASLTNSPDLLTLSGVSFFKKGEDIDLLFKDAFSNIAGQTYRNKDNTVLETTLGTGIEINESSATINHDLNTNANGLHFGEETVDVIPTYDVNTGTAQSASLRIENIQATSVTTAETGDHKTLTFKHFDRNYAAADSFTKNGTGTSLSIGRYATEPTTTSTSLTENFFNETFRYKRDTMENNRNTVQADGYWIDTANADYDSTQNILNTEDLQVHYTGELQYPQNTYPSHLPNIVDYSTTAGNRYYYRAFDLGTGQFTDVTALKVTVGFDSSNALQINNSDDILAGAAVAANQYNPTVTGFDAAKIRIDICVPGNIGPGMGNNTNNPGTKWGIVTANTFDPGDSSEELSETPKTDNWMSTTIQDARYDVIEANVTRTPKGFGTSVTAGSDEHIFIMGLGNINVKFTKGIVLCRVRFKETATDVRHVLEQLKIEAFS